ncbi:MAG: hypothetical protein ACRC1T_09340 [Clostridium chrysemydis]|uniref:ATP-dependent DNA ligase n=1 Tax=Clostridium chrysemydis TaxID=2665504 RepID=UPI003F395CB9
MKKVLHILKLVKETQGTNAKIEFLSNYKDNELLLSVLNLMYNPTISTKLARKKIEKEISLDLFHEVIHSDNEFINYLQNICSGKDSDILSVQEYIDNFEDEDEREMLKEIATQTLSIGMDYKNINKAFGYRFIDLLEPMLAYALEKRLDKIKTGARFSASLKLDGFRTLIKYTKDGIKAYSRNGLEMEGYEEFLERIKGSLPFVNMIYDGELLTQKLYKDSKDGYKAISKIARTKGKKNPNDICFHCFDCIPYDEFIEGISQDDYIRRRFDLEKIIETDYIKVVKSLGIFTVDSPDLYTLLDEVVSNGGEGLMINEIDSKYETKRSTGILKMKKFHSCDLLCLDVLEGDGAFSGMLGSIVVDYKGFKLNVGSGFTEEQRKYYWNNQDEIIGKIVEVKYFEETTNQNGGISLRFPVFQWIRTDKSEPSYN